LRQDYDNFEVLVVDDRSTDDTKKYLTELKQINSNLRIHPIIQTPTGYNQKKYALKTGIAEATYEHLLFTDADCLPCSNSWISEMAKGFFADTAIVLGYSPYNRVPDFLNLLIRYETLVSAIQYLSFSVKGNTYMGVGRNLAYTKTCFYRNNGFESHKETLGGDDDLFVRDARSSQKVNIVFKKEAQTTSIPKESYPEWVTQKRRHMAVGRHYKMPDKIRIGLFMLANVFFYLITIFLLFAQYNLILLAILYVIRSIGLFSVYRAISRKLEENLSFLVLPLLDLIYSVHYLALGISVLIFNKVKWK
jgi:glycosyltransferase involved in cell wall biosynthesis